MKKAQYRNVANEVGSGALRSERHFETSLYRDFNRKLLRNTYYLDNYLPIHYNILHTTTHDEVNYD